MLNILVKNISKRLPDAWHHQVKYALYFKKLPHLSKPTGFSEKIMRRKIYPRSIYTTLSDKFKVREFIAGLWGEEYLVELYAHGTELSYDMFRQLPNTFVLKANHGSGYNRLVFDKRQVSYAELYDLSNAWMRSNFYEQSREKHYLDIEPCIMVERMLLDGEQVPNDIKFHCFNDNHEIRMFIQVDYQRFGTHRRDIFDVDWNRTEIRISLPNADEPMPRPTRLDEMIRLARQTAQQFSYVRVDFYQVGEKVYFGELTFTPGAGLSKLMPKNIEQEWGSYFTE
ncbi:MULTISPECIES: ATP-grasp fold amidoligase family protein [Serratia]|uniref:ATP-grasp fold amidoligase family protein n=1 Tax=Serratia TaxID=613 RepID=UPI000665E72A|nr:ATP-grasp fold amidoligase family protein [Serratia marcescens]HEJ7052460.1 glycosyltransferase [Serratia marcescens]